MHAKRLKTDGEGQYWCDGCESWYDEDTLSDISVTRFYEDYIYRWPDDSSYRYVEDDECISETIWKCGDGCTLTNEPTINTDLWVCGNCDIRYPDMDSAGDCCL